jgi:PD-(D/E)XK nuclease superfamily protein
MCSVLARPAELSAHPVDIGQRTEAIVIAELVRRGYRVLLPHGVNHRYDLVIHVGDRFLRAQCKTGRLRNGRICFKTASSRANTLRAFSRPYHGEIDLFLIYCPETDRVYALDVDDAASGECVLRVEKTANGQAKGIRWAADYELPA